MNEDYRNILDIRLLTRLIVGIGEVADITGVPQRQIRYWEEKGYISSSGGGDGTTRKFDYLNIKKILLIKDLLDDGYTLAAAAQKVEDRTTMLNDAFFRLLDKEEKNGTGM